MLQSDALTLLDNITKWCLMHSRVILWCVDCVEVLHFTFLLCPFLLGSLICFSVRWFSTFPKILFQNMLPSAVGCIWSMWTIMVCHHKGISCSFYCWEPVCLEIGSYSLILKGMENVFLLKVLYVTLRNSFLLLALALTLVDYIYEITLARLLVL